MLQVSVVDRLVVQDLAKLADKQFRFAQAKAQTKVAKFAQMDLKVYAAREFDNPTPYTLNSTYVQPATPSRLQASVGWKDSGRREHYLAPQVHGGDRLEKRFEFHLRRAGALGADEYVVPARGYPLDAFGNVPRKVYAAILSDVQAHPDELSRSSSQSRARRGRRKDFRKRAVYFLAPRGGKLPPGIYERRRTGLGTLFRGVFMFVRKPRYKARYPLQEIVQRNIDTHLETQFDAALAEAMATAR